MATAIAAKMSYDEKKLVRTLDSAKAKADRLGVKKKEAIDAHTAAKEDIGKAQQALRDYRAAQRAKPACDSEE